LDPARLIFIDESSAKTNLTRLCGRAPRAERVHASTPHGHWHTTTMISSIRLDGSTACMAIEGATDTEVFQTYVRQVLCPTLRPGDIVITADIPLASRCVKAGAEVIAPNGRAFTEETIGMTLAVRNLMHDLRSAGEVTRGPPPFSPRDRSTFLSALDAAIRRAQRAPTPPPR